MNHKINYLKYKQKYNNLKKLLGGTSEIIKEICEICPTKEEVITLLDEIKLRLPKIDCIKYTFITDELHTKFNEYYTVNEFNETLPSFINDYYTFLNYAFFEGHIVEHSTYPRKIIIRSNPELITPDMPNSSATQWHNEVGDEFGDNSNTFNNIIYYYKLENCKLDCGTDIAFKKEDSSIEIIRLPVIEGLIISIKDDCVVHKSPVITLINPEKDSTRILIRTFSNITFSDDIKKKIKKIMN